MRKKIMHKRKHCIRWWNSGPLCNVNGDTLLMSTSYRWEKVTCKRCLKMRKEKPVDQSKVVKFRTGCSASGG